MLQMISELIANKKVLLLGFGREGRSSFEVIKKAGGYRKLGIADMANITLPADEQNVTLHTGPTYRDAMEQYDVVFKSPGVVLEKNISEYACDIVSQTEIFFRRYKEQIVGITGTKGKSTTTSLLYHILKESGADCMIAGNIGIPVFERYEDITEKTIIVVELSCHQLEYMTVAPHIGVLINVYEEHLDHYGTVEKYVAAKQNIYKNQTPGDTLYCNIDFLPEKGTCKSHIVTVGMEKQADIMLHENTVQIPEKKLQYVIPTDEIQLMGQHNYFDIAIDYGICMQLGISEEAFTAGLKTYETLPHRLHFVANIGGVKYYDDSISTIGTTTIEALNTLKDAETVLIGGMDRGIDYSDLIAYLNKCDVPNIILMEATGKRIYKEMAELPEGIHYPEHIFVVEHLEDAVKLAKERTTPGHSCVLSPAAASYGIFKNFEERGDRFAELVKGAE